jgi:YHS domain-containing protein
MLRLVSYLLLAIILISVVRSVVGVLLKGLGAVLQPDSPRTARAPAVPMGGELKKDPVCGTFVSTSTSIKRTVGGEVLHFCSESCRKKFRA